MQYRLSVVERLPAVLSLTLTRNDESEEDDVSMRAVFSISSPELYLVVHPGVFPSLCLCSCLSSVVCEHVIQGGQPVLTRSCKFLRAAHRSLVPIALRRRVAVIGVSSITALSMS